MRRMEKKTQVRSMEKGKRTTAEQKAPGGKKRGAGGLHEGVYFGENPSDAIRKAKEKGTPGRVRQKCVELKEVKA